MLGLCWLPLGLLLNNSQLRKTTVNSSKVLLFIRFCVCLSYFLIVVLHVDDKSYEGFVNKAFGRQFLCNSLHFHSQLSVGFRAVFCRFFRLLVRLLESCDLRSKHNMLGKSDVAQSENSLVPCRPFDIFDTV